MTINAHRRLLTLAALGGAASVAFGSIRESAAQTPVRVNYEYRLIDPQPISTGARIEVIEFFWYGCPYCNQLQAPLESWLARKPADTELRRIPALFRDSWVPHARLYYTIEALGELGRLHQAAYRAIHVDGNKLMDADSTADWAASKGVDRQKFIDTYNSFSVQSLTQRAKETTMRYGIPFTPALVIDGRYLTGPSMTSTGDSISYDRFFQVVDQMIAGVRKKAGAK